ncbi:hypothetical protein PHMEG_00018663 [Phytophthora megakarya]|uniref:Chromo domain-containing protein n=1 Tax=Phytophthora megakarya TaxID=4795 RepID=A0A225VTV7_9STRA|nr:hypothetical protein PHMEG_00018663 [Phytophthora megakarya]
MTTSMKRGIGKQTEALAWRGEINSQQHIALEMAKEYQAVEKARRARIHNKKLSRKEQAVVPKGVNDGSPDDDSEPKSLFRPGSRVRLYMAAVRFAYELELPDKSGYRFYPVMHVSRLKAVNEFCDRPKTRLARDVAEEARFDFDEERLPEDSWVPDEVAGEFEVEAILRNRTLMSTSTDRPVREFEVKWVGYESTTLEPASNLSWENSSMTTCGTREANSVYRWSKSRTRTESRKYHKERPGCEAKQLTIADENCYCCYMNA